MVLATVVLVAGVVLGLLPVKATIVQLEPALRQLTVGCGNGYLTTTPPVQPGNLVELPGEPGVFLPRDNYASQCASAVGWHRYASWGLTALGVLGLAVALASSSGGSRGAGGTATPRVKAPSPQAGPPLGAPDGSSASAGFVGGAHRRRPE
jgi:hypothetical protein